MYSSAFGPRWLTVIGCSRPCSLMLRARSSSSSSLAAIWRTLFGFGAILRSGIERTACAGCASSNSEGLQPMVCAMPSRAVSLGLVLVPFSISVHVARGTAFLVLALAATACRTLGKRAARRV